MPNQGHEREERKNKGQQELQSPALLLHALMHFYLASQWSLYAFFASLTEERGGTWEEVAQAFAFNLSLFPKLIGGGCRRRTHRVRTHCVSDASAQSREKKKVKRVC